MWFKEDKDDDEADPGVDKRVDEDFPESYGKFIGAKKGYLSPPFQ